MQWRWRCWASRCGVGRTISPPVRVFLGLVLAVVSGLIGWRPKWACPGGGYSIALVIGLPAVVLAAFETADGGLAGADQLYLPRRMNYADVMIGLYPARGWVPVPESATDGLVSPERCCRRQGHAVNWGR
ncbi:MAG: hypothetical protein CM1200mP2_54760 [Planctomycetaceae bacterium]|nr:MAG: hypothetical protein CM1200mP2_54760 [Planctomycetaceae bacterium]